MENKKNLKDTIVEEKIEILLETKVTIITFNSCICPAIEKVLSSFKIENIFSHEQNLEILGLQKYKPSILNNVEFNRWFPINDNKSRLDIINLRIEELKN